GGRLRFGRAAVDPLRGVGRARRLDSRLPARARQGLPRARGRGPRPDRDGRGARAGGGAAGGARSSVGRSVALPHSVSPVGFKPIVLTWGPIRPLGRTVIGAPARYSALTSAHPGDSCARRTSQSGASARTFSMSVPVCCQWHQNITAGPAPEIDAPTAPS